MVETLEEIRNRLAQKYYDKDFDDLMCVRRDIIEDYADEIFKEQK